MSLIISLPVELLQHILSFCLPQSAAYFSLTCKSAYSLICSSTDLFLWRHLYLNAFDPPAFIHVHYQGTSSNLLPSYDWKNQLIQRMRATTIFFHGPPSAEDRRSAFRAIIASIDDSVAAVSRTGTSDNLSWLKDVIFQTRLLTNLYSTLDSTEDAQLTAQLKSYLTLVVTGTNYKADADVISERESLLDVLLSRRDISRAYVYDLRNYTTKSRWGPFLPDGSVNWVHVEHLVNVVALNIRELPGTWPKTRPPSCLDLSRGRSRDWAGVEGKRFIFPLCCYHISNLVQEPGDAMSVLWTIGRLSCIFECCRNLR